MADKSLFIDIPWTRQPQGAVEIDYSTSLIGEKPLVVVIGGNSKNIVNNQDLSINGIDSKEVMPKGTTHSNNNTGEVGSTIEPLGVLDYVDFWYGTATWDTSKEAFYIVGDYSGTAGTGVFIKHQQASNNLGFFDGVGLVSNGVQFTQNTIHTIVLVKSGGYATLYLDGVFMCQGIIRSPAQSNWAVGNVGFNQGLTFRTPSKTLLAGRVGYNTWNASQVKEFSANPWQIFKPRRVYLSNAYYRYEQKPSVSRGDRQMFVDIPWTRQPQGAVEIDWSNPITSKISSVVVPFGIKLKDITNNRILSNDVTAELSLTRYVGITGVGRRTNSNDLNNTTVLSIKKETIASYAVIWHGELLNTTGRSILFRSNATTVGSTGTFFFTRPGDTIDRISGAHSNPGKVTIALSQVGTSYLLSLNGKTILKGTDAGSLSLVNWVIDGNTGFNESFDASTNLFLVYSSGLSELALNSLTENPWQIFKPRRVHINFSPRQPWSMRESRMRGIADLVTGSDDVDVPRYTPPSLESETAVASRIVTVPSYVRTTQPQGATEIDWGNPITNGLVFNSTPANSTVTTVGTSITRSTFNKGTALTGGISSYLIPVTPLKYSQIQSGNNNAGFTALICGIIRPAAINKAYIFESLSDTAYITVAGSLIYEDSGSSRGLTAPVITGNVNPLIITRTNKFASDKYIKVYNNGTMIASTPDSDGYFDFDLISILGRATYSEYDYSTASYLLFSIWKRALSDQEIKSLSANPWQIFKSNNTPIFGGGTQ